MKSARNWYFWSDNALMTFVVYWIEISVASGLTVVHK